jgi:6-phosphogluconolactonase
MGADAHIASLFPGSPALHEKRRRVYAQFVESAGMWRITLTAVAINRAASITFIVAGPQKASAVAAVLEGPHTPAETPAQIVAPADGEVLWLLDSDAAAGLSRQGS